MCVHVHLSVHVCVRPCIWNAGHTERGLPLNFLPFAKTGRGATNHADPRVVWPRLESVCQKKWVRVCTSVCLCVCVWCCHAKTPKFTLVRFMIGYVLPIASLCWKYTIASRCGKTPSNLATFMCGGAVGTELLWLVWKERRQWRLSALRPRYRAQGGWLCVGGGRVSTRRQKTMTTNYNWRQGDLFRPLRFPPRFSTKEKNVYCGLQVLAGEVDARMYRACTPQRRRRRERATGASQKRRPCKASRASETSSTASNLIQTDLLLFACKKKKKKKSQF